MQERPLKWGVQTGTSASYQLEEKAPAGSPGLRELQESANPSAKVCAKGELAGVFALGGSNVAERVGTRPQAALSRPLDTSSTSRSGKCPARCPVEGPHNQNRFLDEGEGKMENVLQNASFQPACTIRGRFATSILSTNAAPRIQNKVSLYASLWGWITNISFVNPPPPNTNPSGLTLGSKL